MSQLAENLMPLNDGEDLDFVIRRLRHWTVAGILPTIGGVNPGGGRHNRYPRESLLLAGVLDVVANHGATIGMLRQVSADLQHVAAGNEGFRSELWESIEKREKPMKHEIYIIASLEAANSAHAGGLGGTYWFTSDDLVANNGLIPATDGIVVNLTAISRVIKS